MYSRVLPEPVRQKIGRILAIVQMGNMPAGAKYLKGFPIPIQEIRVAHQGDAYRAIYTLALGDRVYLLHVFQKKSRKGISTPQRDVELIRQRIKYAEHLESERNG